MSDTNRREQKPFEEIIRDNIIKNIKGLMAAEGFSQHEFAELTGISAAALSGYLNVNKQTIPDVTYIAKLCTVPRFKKYGLTLDDFVTHRIEFERVVYSESTTEDIDYTAKKGYTGTYLIYIFEQSKDKALAGVDSVRELRYGVISIFEQWNLSDENDFIAIAKFFKTLPAAEKFKESVDDLPKHEDTFANADAIRRIYQDNDRYYTGHLEFTMHHTFINLNSTFYGDNALMVFHAPQKKSDTDYIGGVGCVSSVSHGNNHMPIAQKIIISRYPIKRSNEEIAEHLQMNRIDIGMKAESDVLIALLRKLYVNSADGYADFLDEQDKKSIFEGRLNQIVREYLENNLCGVGFVSTEDDYAVYNIIKSCIPDGSRERLLDLLDGSTD